MYFTDKLAAHLGILGTVLKLYRFFSVSVSKEGIEQTSQENNVLFGPTSR